MRIILIYLALGNLVIGSAGFMLGGLLEPLADGLEVSVAAAGQLMTAYALANAIGSPLLIAASSRLKRKPLLLWALALVAGGNLLAALIDSLGEMLIARIIMALGAGVYTPVAAALAVSLCPAEQRGRALALVFLGIAASFLIGAPLGAWLAYEIGWRWPFIVLTAATLAVLLLLARRLPPDIDAPTADFRTFVGVLREPRLVLALLVMLLYMGGVFVCNTYIGPLLRYLTGADSGQLSLLLTWFGAVAVIGNLLGGQALDRLGSERALRLGLIGLASGMALLTTGSGSVGSAALFLALWAVSGFSLMAPQQARLVQLGGARATALLSLNASMLYLGTALGALVGGAMLPLVGYRGLGPTGAVLVMLALGCVWLSRPRHGKPVTQS